MKPLRLGSFVTLLAIVLGVTGLGASAQTELKPGDALPDFKLKDTAGTEHSLSEHAGSIVVLDFCSLECPWSKGADPGLAAIANEYKDKGVVFYGIDSHQSTTVEQIQAYAQEKGIPFPVLKDEGNQYADALGALVTPEIYIVDKEGKLAYHGAFDDRNDPNSTGEKNYVRMALDALLAGTSVEPNRVKAWGCTIKRAPKPAVEAPAAEPAAAADGN